MNVPAAVFRNAKTNTWDKQTNYQTYASTKFAIHLS
jgi:hypothetical protein